MWTTTWIDHAQASDNSLQASKYGTFSLAYKKHSL